MSLYTIDQAKVANLRAANWLRNNTDKELLISFAGGHQDAGGVWLTLYLSGFAAVNDRHLPSSELQAERQELQSAFKYYMDVRKAARAIAPTLLPKKCYVRDGRTFRLFA